MLVSVADFAEERKQDRDTVNAYIRNHPEIHKETVKRGRYRYLDTDTAAFRTLERKYPLEKPVEVIEDTEARRQLIDAQQMIIKLQQQLVDAAPKIALAEQNQRLLDDMQLQNQELHEQLEAARQQLAEEQAKTWWDKLRGR